MIFFAKYISSLLLIFLVFSCASTNTSTDKADTPKSTYQPTSVLDYLRIMPGVSVSGNRISVANGSPMFIVNGNRMSYQTLISTVSVYRIKSARLSKSQTDIKVYSNVPGITGIIFIETD